MYLSSVQYTLVSRYINIQIYVYVFLCIPHISDETRDNSDVEYLDLTESNSKS